MYKGYGYRIKVSGDPVMKPVLLGKFFMCPMSEEAAAVANANKESLISDLISAILAILIPKSPFRPPVPEAPQRPRF